MAIAHFTIKGHHENILGFDVLNGQICHVVTGSVVPSAQTETGNLLYGYYTQPLHHLTHCSIQSVLWHEIEFLKSQLVRTKDNHLQNHSPLSHLSGQFDHHRRH